MDRKARTPRGPKPRPSSELKRNSITFRALGDLRERLVASARGNGRSLSEEIEVRLEYTMEETRLLEILLGSGPLAPMFKAFREVIPRVVHKCEKQSIDLSSEEVNLEINSAIYFLARYYLRDGESIPSSPNASGDLIHNRSPGDVGVSAAWDWLAFSDEERFGDSRSVRKPSRTLEKIMGR